MVNAQDHHRPHQVARGSVTRDAAAAFSRLSIAALRCEQTRAPSQVPQDQRLGLFASRDLERPHEGRVCD